MKLHAIAPIVFAIILAATGSAFANHYTSFDGGADCNGFWANGEIYFAGGVLSINVNYEVTLMQGSTTVETITGSVAVSNNTGLLDVSGVWGEELCGDYSASGTFWFETPQGSDSRTFTATFTCICEEEGGCHFTPGYWKNHPEAWPVTTLTLGGILYNQAQLLAILDLPVRQDPTVILAHHLIAAMLNVANGADPSISGAIDDANALLVTYPLGSNPKGAAKDMIIDAKNVLCAYNEMILPGCEGYIVPTFDQIMGTSAAPDEKSTWGDIKSIYK